MQYFLGDLSSERIAASRGDVLLRARTTGACYQQVSTDGQGMIRVLLRPSQYAVAIGGGWFSTQAAATKFCRMAAQFGGVKNHAR